MLFLLLLLFLRALIVLFIAIRGMRVCARVRAKADDVLLQFHDGGGGHETTALLDIIRTGFYFSILQPDSQKSIRFILS